MKKNEFLPSIQSEESFQRRDVMRLFDEIQHSVENDMAYNITDKQREQIQSTVQIDDPHRRINKLAEVTIEIGEQNDTSDMKSLATHIATREVVGTGMNMTLSEVLEHLSDLARIQDSVDIPTHGGDEDLLEELTLNERFDHDVYYALQTLYGKLIYTELPEHQKEIVNLR